MPKHLKTPYGIDIDENEKHSIVFTERKTFMTSQPQVLSGEDADGVRYEISTLDIWTYTLKEHKRILSPIELYGIIAWATDHPVKFGPIARMILSAN